LDPAPKQPQPGHLKIKKKVTSIAGLLGKGKSVYVMKFCVSSMQMEQEQNAHGKSSKPV
jgi:hypothetical protein